MDNKEPSWFQKWYTNCTQVLGRFANRVSKLFDKVIYNDKATFIATGIVAISLCISTNYQDLSFRLFNTGAVTLNLAAVPVEILVDENTYEVSGVPNTADITVEGDTADIQLVRTQNRAGVTADLRNLGEGTSTVALDASGLPTGLTVRVTPATVQVTLAKKYSKTFFITPDLIVGTGQSINAYNKPTLSLRSVTVRATRDKLNTIRAVRAIVDTSGHDGGFSAEVPLVAYDSLGHQVIVTMTPQTVQATVTMANETTAQPKAISTTEEGLITFSSTEKSNAVQGPQQS